MAAVTMGEGDMFHLADILDVTLVKNNFKLSVNKPKRASINLRGFAVDTSPVSIDGIVTKQYAALDLYMGGKLHLYIVCVASRSISNFTTLLIGEETPTETPQEAFWSMKDLPTLEELLTILEPNTKQGFWTDGRKQWRQLPEAAHLDLLKRGDVDANLWALLNAQAVAQP